MPLRKDWAVLDGLNYIKDELDGTLSLPLVVPDGHLRQLRHDGQRRAEADLRDVPRPTTRPARSGSSRCANFPVIRDLVVDIDDFMHKLPRVKPWIIRDEEQPVEDGEYLQTPAQLDDYKQFSMCINCMLCYAACPVYGLDPRRSSARRRSRSPQRYNLDSRDEGDRERLDVLIAARGRLGLHVRRRVHRGRARSTSTRRAPSSGTSSGRGAGRR